MRYDAEGRKILISNREFVTTARRGIATAVPSDSEEPELGRISKRFLSRIIGKADRESINYDFVCNGYKFTLTAKAERIDGCKLWFATEAEGNPSKPKKECAAQLRGEGYVAAYAYAKQNELPRVNLNFIFMNFEAQTHTEREEWVTLDKLERFFKKCADSVAIYAKPEIERVTLRLPTMKNLKFPYKMAREGQREFIQTAYKSIVKTNPLSRFPTHRIFLKTSQSPFGYTPIPALSPINQP